MEKQRTTTEEMVVNKLMAFFHVVQRLGWDGRPACKAGYTIVTGHIDSARTCLCIAKALKKKMRRK